MGILFLCLLACFAFSGCRNSTYGDYSGTLPAGTASISGIVTAALAGGPAIRAVPAGAGVKGAAVWIEELPGFTGTTDDNGFFVITGVPAGTFNVVARFVLGGKTYKTRQKAIVVENNANSEVDLNVAEAKNIVKGVLLDSDGNPLPLGTKLYLWGEEFEVIDANGSFISPPLPDLVLEELIQEIIINRGLPNQFNLPVSFVSDDEPLEVRIYVPASAGDVNRLPKVALVAIKDGQQVTEVAGGAQVTIRASFLRRCFCNQSTGWGGRCS